MISFSKKGRGCQQIKYIYFLYLVGLGGGGKFWVGTFGVGGDGVDLEN